MNKTSLTLLLKRKTPMKTKREKPKPATIDEIIESQQDFIHQQYLALVLLEAYRGNPEEFKLLFNEQIRKDYNYIDTNPEFIWEFCNEIADAIDYGIEPYGHFALEPNGLFSALVYSGKKKKK